MHPTDRAASRVEDRNEAKGYPQGCRNVGPRLLGTFGDLFLLSFSFLRLSKPMVFARNTCIRRTADSTRPSSHQPNIQQYETVSPTPLSFLEPLWSHCRSTDGSLLLLPMSKLAPLLVLMICSFTTDRLLILLPPSCKTHSHGGARRVARAPRLFSRSGNHACSRLSAAWRRETTYADSGLGSKGMTSRSATQHSGRACWWACSGSVRHTPHPENNRFPSLGRPQIKTINKISDGQDSAKINEKVAASVTPARLPREKTRLARGLGRCHSTASLRRCNPPGRTRRSGVGRI